MDARPRQFIGARMLLALPRASTAANGGKGAQMKPRRRRIAMTKA
jgi:hypothetical protein